MSSLTNINNNSRVVNVGRTTPVAPGQQPAAKSIPVVLASDQSAIPVVEQNKVQSEVSLSLLGIPRSEVALGIFADVNTYDVNPTEWSSSPQYYNKDQAKGYGIKHLPNEAGALVEAPRDKKAVLTSKRFFRYQPGRVSAATFGVKASVSDAHYARNPVIRKYGIFDNFDGYYWESIQSGQEDNFSVVRRTQSLLKFPSSPFGLTSELLRKPEGSGEDDKAIPFNQTDDYRVVGKEGTEIKGGNYVREVDQLLEDSIDLAVGAFDDLLSGSNGAPATNALKTYFEGINDAAAEQVYRDKCHRDAKFWIDMMAMDLEWGGNGHTNLNTKNYTTALLNNSGAEAAFYTQLRAKIGNSNVYGSNSGTVWSATSVGLDALTNIPILFFTAVTGNNQGTLYQAYTNSSNNTNLRFGSKSRIETLFDTRKHYWSYFVSSFQYNSSDVDDKNNYQTYEFQTNSINALFTPDTEDDLESLVGYNLTSDPTSGVYYPYSEGNTLLAADLPNSGSDIPLTADQALALNEYYQNIKFKCSRDIEYVINGYKNDTAGGGNAETLYNASMYYKGAGLSIYTQTENGIPQEVAKHKHLRDWIKTDLNDGQLSLGATSSTVSEIDELSDVVIDNFTTETTEGVELGTRGFAGNLVVFRDGLLMVHAAVNDPNLLKEIKSIKAHVARPTIESEPTRFKLTRGIVTFGQKVRVTNLDGETVIGGGSEITLGNKTLTPTETKYGKIYNVSRVYGPTGNEFSLQDQDGNDVYAEKSGNLSDDTIYIETVVPFIGDVTYDPATYRVQERPEGMIRNGDGSNFEGVLNENDDPFPKGMQWPLMYSSSTQLKDTTAKYIGHINTTLSPNDATEIGTIRQEYDKLNFTPEYINWIKNNVKPEFWGVYEYRVPRSRFSHDKLDGKTTKRVYSDLATGATGIVRPGMEVLNDDGVWVDATSEYEFDFTKVTMLKIEFSWYGAVGALFLAYVPIGNGESRWVRVHHLRASNQLKIASLGNATLPITYNVWGGGSTDTLGDGETKTHTYGTSQSHHIVKYGASYYIDGGDRGTVRLYSHNNNDTVASHGKQWEIESGNTYTAAEYAFDPSNTQTISTDATDLPLGADLVYFMGAQVKTNNPIDTGIKVDWIDAANNKIYFTRMPQGTGLTLIPDRADLVYGLETKDVIKSTIEGNPVRNRVQVYPTKMSTANMGNKPVRLRMKRTPIFQTLAQPQGTFALTAEHIISPSNNPLPFTDGSTPYLQNGEELFGWFEGLVGGVDNETIFGRLYKETNQYYFEVLQSFNDVVVLNNAGEFLADRRYVRGGNTDGEVVTSTTETKNLVPLADQLTSVNAINNTVVPIPNTGSNVATLYLQPNGTEQVNLDTYFDYNKEYLSYPLTDQAETLYFAIDSDNPVSEKHDIAVGLTWEEQ